MHDSILTFKEHIVGPLHIVITTPAFDAASPCVDEACLAKIRSTVPDAVITDISSLVLRELRGDEAAAREMDAILAYADIIFGFVPPRDITRRAPNLKWLQATSAGVDRLTGSDVWNSDVIITGVSGIHAAAISEFVLGAMLMWAKGSLNAFRNQREHAWQRYGTSLLAGRTLGIVGLGHIGRETARLAKAFNMEVIATRRSARQGGKARNVDALLPQSGLKKLLSLSDYVVLSTPLTPETRNLIGADELAAMKPSAFLVNISRGGVIDETALVTALKNKMIAGAALDVTVHEPLPPENPLWDFDNVIISPHVSGGMDDYMLRATEIFCENLERYRSGRRLINVVRRERGY